VSLYDYERSKKLEGEPFYGLIMAAMRRADTDNMGKLEGLFPEVWDELHARYHAPGGVLEEDQVLGPDGECPHCGETDCRCHEEVGS